MSRYIGSQWRMQSYFLTQFVQVFVDVFQRFLYTFQDLFLGRVNLAVKDWKQIIFLYLVCVVLVDNLLCLFRQTAIHHLACLASCIVDSAILDVAISQQGNVFEIDSSHEIREQKDVVGKLGVKVPVRSIQLNQFVDVLFRNGPFAGVRP